MEHGTSPLVKTRVASHIFGMPFESCASILPLVFKDESGVLTIFDGTVVGHTSNKTFLREEFACWPLEKDEHFPFEATHVFHVGHKLLPEVLQAIQETDDALSEQELLEKLPLTEEGGRCTAGTVSEMKDLTAWFQDRLLRSSVKFLSAGEHIRAGKSSELSLAFNAENLIAWGLCLHAEPDIARRQGIYANASMILAPNVYTLTELEALAQTFIQKK